MVPYLYCSHHKDLKSLRLLGWRDCGGSCHLYIRSIKWPPAGVGIAAGLRLPSEQGVRSASEVDLHKKFLVGVGLPLFHQWLGSLRPWLLAGARRRGCLGDELNWKIISVIRGVEFQDAVSACLQLRWHMFLAIYSLFMCAGTLATDHLQSTKWPGYYNIARSVENQQEELQSPGLASSNTASRHTCKNKVCNRREMS